MSCQITAVKRFNDRVRISYERHESKFKPSSKFSSYFEIVKSFGDFNITETFLICNMTQATEPLPFTRDENFRPGLNLDSVPNKQNFSLERCAISKKLFDSTTQNSQRLDHKFKSLEADATFINGLYSRHDYTM